MRRKIIRRNKGTGTTSSIESLPQELLTKVLAQVASSSIADLCNAKLSCKILLQAANDDYIFEHASMAKFHIPWPPSNNYAKLFLKRCKKSGNPETLYRLGMYEYFSLGRINSGFQLLTRAAAKKHAEATYVYAIITLCSAAAGRRFRRRGFELLSSLKSSRGGIRECRKNIREIVHNLWIRNIIVVDEDGELYDDAQITCRCSRTKQQRRGWDDEFDVFIDGCESCLCVNEVTFFSNLVRDNFYV